MQSNLPASIVRQDWDLVIQPKTGWFDIHLADLWRYRDLLWMFVRRDFVAVYKQTLLGPLWFFIQPLLTTLTFTVIFSGVAKLSTDGLPPVLFYLAGATAWSYFATCLTKTANTFKDNANLFGKVYFPRLITPLSIIISTLVQFVIQFASLLVGIGWFMFQRAEVHPHWMGILLVTPILILMMGGLGLGSGIVISSLTTKYRDLAFLITFGVQLAMYATPVVYPLSSVPEKYRFWLELNPMSGIIEAFRTLYLGAGSFSWALLGYSAAATAIILFLGIVIFNRVEKTFMDTV